MFYNVVLELMWHKSNQMLIDCNQISLTSKDGFTFFYATKSHFTTKDCNVCKISNSTNFITQEGKIDRFRTKIGIRLDV